MVVTLEGCNYFSQRIILSTLSGKTLKLKGIRSSQDNPGLKDFEISLIRLVEKITNGSRFEIPETGTSLYYNPGTLYGGEADHDCDLGRGIGYYLMALMCFAPFCRYPLKVTLRGCTSSPTDPSVDRLKYAALPVLKKYMGFDEGLDIQISRRGVLPGGGGRVTFSCPIRTKLLTHQWLESGRVKRIRGTAWAVRVSPAQSNRLVESARAVINRVCHDVYITTDHRKGESAGKSPGFGITLVAELTEGSVICAEALSPPSGSASPEDIGKQAAVELLREIYCGGVTDASAQALSCLLMVLGPNDVSKIVHSEPTPYTIQFLRHIEQFFGIVFKIDKHEEDDSSTAKHAQQLLFTCVGAAYSNINKITL